MTLGLDWVAIAFGLTGCYLVGHHNKYGWIAYMLGSVLMFYLGLKAEYYGIACGCLIYLALEYRGWKRSNK